MLGVLHATLTRLDTNGLVWFQDTGASTSSSHPGCCEEGFTLFRKQICVPCEPGSHKGEKMQRCKKCPSNTYQDTAAAETCKPCPDHSTTDVTGASSIDYCKGYAPTDQSKAAAPPQRPPNPPPVKPSVKGDMPKTTVAPTKSGNTSGSNAGPAWADNAGGGNAMQSAQLGLLLGLLIPGVVVLAAGIALIVCYHETARKLQEQSDTSSSKSLLLKGNSPSYSHISRGSGKRTYSKLGSVTQGSRTHTQGSLDGSTYSVKASKHSMSSNRASKKIQAGQGYSKKARTSAQSISSLASRSMN